MTALLDFYLTRMKVEMSTRFQYRMDVILQLLGKFVEPVIYLVVWTTIARQRGGEVSGYTEAQFAGYFIVWTMVRMLTMGWSPFQMEWRIREGYFNQVLLRPLHPIHEDTALMMSWKVVEMTTVIPTMILLSLIFRPELQLEMWSVAAFIPAVLLAFAARYIFLWAIALSAFWTTRITALFNMLFSVEFLISGRIAPVDVLPLWAQQISDVLPFKWMFGFPLELLIGRVPPEDLPFGFGMQLFWLVVMTVVLLITWRFAVRRYSAVGG